MTRDDLIRFANRDWSAIAIAKERDWLRRKQRASAADLFRLSDDLHRHARAVARAGPSQADRQRDAEVHRRVGEALRAVTRAAR